MFERIRSSRATLAGVLSAVALLLLLASPVGAAVDSVSQPVASNDGSVQDYDASANNAEPATEDQVGPSSHLAALIPRAPASPGASGSVHDFVSVSRVAPSSAVVRALDDVLFPNELAGGAANVHVCLGVRNGKPVYAGITNDLGRWGTQHADRFVLDPLTTAPMTRGQAPSDRAGADRAQSWV